MWVSDHWNEYELLDTSDGERLERWGKYTLIRPDPQIIWKNVRRHPGWMKADALYNRSGKGGGSWSIFRVPTQWNLSYTLSALPKHPLHFIIRPTGFKHTGLFPEQAVNWDWMAERILKAGRPIKVLNLFAYTGGATVACAAAGASVCHVDAARGMVAQAKENAALSGLSDAPIRYIVEDCQRFAERELRRGNRYDAILMDPPSYGRGPSGEIWKLEDSIGTFLSLTAQLLSDRPLFVVVNSYTTGLSPSVMRYLLSLTVKERFGGAVASQELGLPVTQTGECLPCGATARWTCHE